VSALRAPIVEMVGHGRALETIFEFQSGRFPGSSKIIRGSHEDGEPFKRSHTVELLQACCIDDNDFYPNVAIPGILWLRHNLSNLAHS